MTASRCRRSGRMSPGCGCSAGVAYLHYAHAIGLERLRCLLGEIFGLSISEGALCNILARATAPLAAAAAVTAARVTAAAEIGRAHV